MKLNVIAPNQTEVKKGDVTIFFSYSTPVVAIVPGRGFLVTREKYSRTTSKHINQYLDGVNYTEVEQSEIDAIANS